MNLMTEVRPDAAARDGIVKRYGAESDPAARMELLTRLAQLDDRDTVAAMLRLLEAEKNAAVREQIIALVGFLRSAPGELKLVCESLSRNYKTATRAERLRTLDAVSNVPDGQSATTIRTLSDLSPAKSDERFAADDAIVKLASTMKVEAALVKEAQEELRERQWSGKSMDADE